MKDLVRGRLIRRYKRFLADVRMPDDRIVTVHCPNTGSMKNCVFEDAEVMLSKSDNPKRKYAYTWEYTRTPKGHVIGVNTGRANALVADAVASGKIPELDGYRDLQREVRYGDENSRIDLLLSDRPGDRGGAGCYVEVKSVTLLEDPPSRGVGYFPDAVSDRGVKHLRELQSMKQQGHRAVLFFCVQHTGIREVRPADHIHPAYGDQLRVAATAGVEILAYKARVTSKGFRLSRSLPVNL